MKHTRRDATLVFLLLLLILALAAGLRFYQIGAQSLWSDEGNSAALATRSLDRIARDASRDIHPPLYYWLLHLWSTVFGVSESGLRSLSAILGTLLVLITAEIGRRLHGKALGLIAAFIAAVSPFQVYYSQEARMYIMLAAEAALSLLVFWWLLSQEERKLPPQGEPAPGRPRWLTLYSLGLVATWLFGLYTHYAFPLMIALQTALYIGWVAATRRRGFVPGRLLHWVVLLAVAFAIYLPWLSISIHQIATWPAATPPGDIGQILGALATMLTLGPVALGWAPHWWVWLLLALGLAGALCWAISTERSSARSSALGRLAWITPVAWLLAPLALILALQLYRDAYLKFLLIASPALVLLQARGILAPTGWRTSASPAFPDGTTTRGAGLPVLGILEVLYIVGALGVIGGLSGLTLVRYYNDPAAARDDYRGMAQFIQSNARPGDAILLDAPGQSEVFDFYYNGELPVYPLPRQRPMDWQATEQELAKLLDHNKVYAIYWATEEADPDNLIEGWLNSRGYKTLDQWRGNVRLAVYVMPEHRPPDEASDDLNLQLGDDITLLGYQGWNPSPPAGEVTQLQLKWRADQAPRGRYKVFLQLLDASDQVVAQNDAEPAGGSRPTDTWAPGEEILDNHGLLIPPGTPPGTYQRIVGMYDPATLERRRLPDGSDHIELPPITVSRDKTPPPLDAFSFQYGQRFDFGAVSLLGHDRYRRGFGHLPDAPLQPGDLLHVTFYWQADATPRADWWFDLTLSDKSGQTVANLHAPLVSETYSTTVWNPGEIVRGEHDLTIPEAVPPGTYRLSLTALPDIETPVGTAYLGSVRVSPSLAK